MQVIKCLENRSMYSLSFENRREIKLHNGKLLINDKVPKHLFCLVERCYVLLCPLER